MKISDVADVLGLEKEIATEIELADAVQEGLPSSALDAVHAALSPDQPLALVLRLVGAERTLARKRATGAPLSVGEGDRVARVARLLVRMEEAFGGDRQKVRLWVQRPNRSLFGRTPLSLLGTDAGATAVEHVLGRLEHGLF